MKKNLLILSFLAPILFVGCKVGNSDVNDKLKWVQEPKLVTEYSEYLGWSVTIDAIAQNISGDKLSYVQCSFSLYDKDGINLGSAYDNIADLAKDDKWHVEAKYLGFLTTEPVRFVFNEFTHF